MYPSASSQIVEPDLNIEHLRKKYDYIYNEVAHSHEYQRHYCMGIIDEIVRNRDNSYTPSERIARIKEVLAVLDDMEENARREKAAQIEEARKQEKNKINDRIIRILQLCLLLNPTETGKKPRETNQRFSLILAVT